MRQNQKNVMKVLATNMIWTNKWTNIFSNLSETNRNIFLITPSLSTCYNQFAKITNNENKGYNVPVNQRVQGSSP